MEAAVIDTAWQPETRNYGAPKGNCQEGWKTGKPDKIDPVAAKTVIISALLVQTGYFTDSEEVVWRVPRHFEHHPWRQVKILRVRQQTRHYQGRVRYRQGKTAGKQQKNGTLPDRKRGDKTKNVTPLQTHLQSRQCLIIRQFQKIPKNLTRLYDWTDQVYVGYGIAPGGEGLSANGDAAGLGNQEDIDTFQQRWTTALINSWTRDKN